MKPWDTNEVVLKGKSNILDWLLNEREQKQTNVAFDLKINEIKTLKTGGIKEEEVREKAVD